MGKFGDFLPALGLGAGYGLATSAGGTTVTVCNGANENTFYCKFVQFFSIFKMFISFIFIMAIIVWLCYTFLGMKASGRSGSGRGRKMRGG